MEKRKPYWPVVGGAKECALCGEQNYTNEYCYICPRCDGNGCSACDGTKGSDYNPEPY